MFLFRNSNDDVEYISSICVLEPLGIGMYERRLQVNSEAEKGFAQGEGWA